MEPADSKKIIYSPAQLFELIVESNALTEILWSEYIVKARKFHLSKSGLRGFKRFMTVKQPDGRLVLKKDLFVKHLSHFPNIFFATVYGSDCIKDDHPGFMWLGKAFSVPGFFCNNVFS